MRNLQTKKLVEELAEEFGLTQAQVWDIVKSPYWFQTHIMKEVADAMEEYMPTVRIWGSGMFYCNAFSRKDLKKYVEYHKNKNNEITGTE